MSDRIWAWTSTASYVGTSIENAAQDEDNGGHAKRYYSLNASPVQAIQRQHMASQSVSSIKRVGWPRRYLNRRWWRMVLSIGGRLLVLIMHHIFLLTFKTKRAVLRRTDCKRSFATFLRIEPGARKR